MNKRIKEQMGQTLDEKFAGTWSTMDMQDLTKFAERFAELIVQECAQTLIDNTPVLDEYESEEDWDRGYSQAMRDCIHHIKEHFGVEESQGWVCPKCGTDRTKAACPQGHTAALTGDCPMYGEAQ